MLRLKKVKFKVNWNDTTSDLHSQRGNWLDWADEYYDIFLQYTTDPDDTLENIK